MIICKQVGGKGADVIYFKVLCLCMEGLRKSMRYSW